MILAILAPSDCARNKIVYLHGLIMGWFILCMGFKVIDRTAHRGRFTPYIYRKIWVSSYSITHRLQLSHNKHNLI